MGDNVIVKAVFDDWQLSGISTFLSGTYSNFTYTFYTEPRLSTP